MTIVVKVGIINVWDNVLIGMPVSGVVKPSAAMKRPYGDELKVGNGDEDSFAQPQP